ncbi:glycogen debranching enzyme isoform X3 [Lingula anatina]|uniref:Glycogen debranching enzyme n=1 Tax=Lingula anatina TaxID=7574 RepID=A0A1S3HNH7_LINAN|nr:glycogen debranching enzyme isoform X3 [Lingula anatina]|eukprot:XP_013387613.1 glycogen debranching enzyme isoform X3 [Lingula anatina]
MAEQVRVLVLEKGENKESTLYRLEKGWKLHFVQGPSLQVENVRVFCNHPTCADVPFSREKYTELLWQNPSSMKSDVIDMFVEVNIVCAGSFNYYFTIDGGNNELSPNGRGSFLVDPVMHVGLENEPLPMDCVQVQSVLTKCLGPFEGWKDKLKVAKESGYNMVHFTPLQELGYSNSSYSLRDQLKLNPLFCKNKQYTMDDVAELIKLMKNEWKVLSMTDLVYNHTANDSPWIQEHPECVYNLVNSPHLKPSYFLDRMLWHVTLDVAGGKLEYRGITPVIKSETDLEHIRSYLNDELLPKYKLHEFYTVDVDQVIKSFKSQLGEGLYTDLYHTKGDLQIVQDPQFKRLGSTVDMAIAMKLFNVDKPGIRTRDERIRLCCEDLRVKLEELNQEKVDEIHGHLQQAVTNFLANIRYRFLQDGGPKYDKVTRKQPLMFSYFLPPPGPEFTLEKEEQLMHTDKANVMFAHNGWVMGDDPLRNFAEPGSNVYLRRELIVWGDSVKLRYGEKYEDCPFLWDHMRQYTVQTVEIFHAVRLDNCHSTPLHVAEYMLDAARKIRPDLYVVAELFTRSEHTDNIFMNHLGINSLIREAQSAWDSHEEGRLVYRYGGEPVGAFMKPAVRPLVPAVAHALFYDLTHDNMSPVQRRSVYDMLPTAALVSMACCATGSNRGYDELVPHHIHVVEEGRPYASWTDQTHVCHATINMCNGIVAGKRALNRLHFELGKKGFNQVFVDQRDYDTVAVTRHNPHNHMSVVLVARTAFKHPHSLDTGYIPPLHIAGVIETVVLESHLQHRGHHAHKKDPQFINGLPDFHCHIREDVSPDQSQMVHIEHTENSHINVVHFHHFPPGSVIAFRIALDPVSTAALTSIATTFSQLPPIKDGQFSETSPFHSIVSKLTLSDLNRVLYRCDNEERDDGKGFGAYNVPRYGSLVYCGLQGVMSVMGPISLSNDLGHPLCCNLRDGDWLPGYIAARLKAQPSTQQLGEWFEAVFEQLSKLPRYLIPSYFDAILTQTSSIIHDAAWCQMSTFIKTGSTFVKALSLGSVQMCGYVKTARLPDYSPGTTTSVQNAQTDDGEDKEEVCHDTLSAGLPHFSSGIWRNWGRDTFIALRGLLLIPGRHDVARNLILAYGSCMRHGLIPNLLGDGTHARYNCRDAVWWWMQSIKDYTKMVPDGSLLLQEFVSRMYPTDDSEPQKPGAHNCPLYDVIQEALQKHIDGISFKERNAGPKLDMDMTDAGFTVQASVDMQTGFISGGNVHNCGTWMDKMGSSNRAGNKGKPATPRDGSAVELIGLSKSVLRWLIRMNEEGAYPYSGVKAKTKSQEVTITFKDWDKKIQASFERYFWIHTSPVPEYEPRPSLVNKRGMYKDSHGASHEWADYQLRPNFCVAMVVAPELFTPTNAWSALSLAENVLLGPLGMKTLDPSDWAYDGDYDNDDDSGNPKRAKGFNYHQGPEWLWPIGYFLRAKLLFAKILDKSKPGLLDDTVKCVKRILSKHHQEIISSHWRSLPELTNSNGKPCRHSSSAQAWSVSCVLEVLYDLEKMDTKAQKRRKSKS